MYALVVCLDNIKRVIPLDYIQKREEDGSIAVFVSDKQRFCNAVILDKSDDKDELLDKMKLMDERKEACVKRKLPNTFSSSRTPSPKRPRESSSSPHPGRGPLLDHSPGPGSSVQEHHCDGYSSRRKIITEQEIEEKIRGDGHGEYYSCDAAGRDATSGEWLSNGDSGFHRPLSVTSKSPDLGNDVSLTHILCEVLQDQRSLERRVKKMEDTLQQILETVSKTCWMVEGQVGQQLQGSASIPPHQTEKSRTKESGIYDRLSDEGLPSDGQPLNNVLIKSEQTDTKEASYQEGLSDEGSISGVHTNHPTADRQESSRALPKLLQGSSGSASAMIQVVPLILNENHLDDFEDFVSIPIRQCGGSSDDTNVEELQPILIPHTEYRHILLKYKTPTAFCRSLLRYFFTEGTLKTHNFRGGLVRTKQGTVIRGQLNPRMVLSLIDQVEKEFPGSTKGRENMRLLKKAINDKCNHM